MPYLPQGLAGHCKPRSSGAWAPLAGSSISSSGAIALKSLSWDAFVDLYRMRDHDHTLKIPDGMAAQLFELGGAGASEVKRLNNKFRVEQRTRQDLELQAVQADLADLESQQAAKATKTRQKSIDAKRRKVEKLQAAMTTPSVAAAGGYRIYPYQFAPIILQDGPQRLIVPARYRILPRTGVEVPHQYNVFNARRDSLQSARTWKPLFGHKHALSPSSASTNGSTATESRWKSNSPRTATNLCTRPVCMRNAPSMVFR